MPLVLLCGKNEKGDATVRHLEEKEEEVEEGAGGGRGRGKRGKFDSKIGRAHA